MKTAVILAGGLGTRLNVKDTPKAMLKLGNSTLIQHQINWLGSQGFDNIIICLGYLHEKVKWYPPEQGVQVKFVTEEIPLGTAGAVKLAFTTYPELCPKGVLVVNVDDLCFQKLDWDSFFDKGHQYNQPTVLCKALPFSVWVENTMFAQNEAMQHIGHTYIPGGAMKALPDQGSLEKWLAGLSKMNKVSCLVVRETEWLTMNNVEQWKEVQRKWRAKPLS